MAIGKTRKGEAGEAPGAPDSGSKYPQGAELPDPIRVNLERGVQEAIDQYGIPDPNSSFPGGSLPDGGGIGGPEGRTGEGGGPLTQLPEPIMAPASPSLPNTPMSMAGTFAMPGSAGAAAYRSPNFAMNRGLGTVGEQGRKRRYGAGVPIAGMEQGLGAADPEELAKRVAMAMGKR